MTKAWMLRQDGTAFDVKIHLYTMESEELESEAEVASFLIATQSEDQPLCEYVLDSWMAKLIESDIRYDSTSEDIDNLIIDKLQHLPYKFPYELSVSDYIAIHHKLNNYDSVDSFYDFLDSVDSELENIQASIKHSVNQQFCRVRFGGKYNNEGSGCIWCRISSVGYNWANTLYLFIASKVNSLGITSVSICRDPESDGHDDEGIAYFYRAKDGVPYMEMPIDEYLAEEHEYSPVFSSLTGLGVINTIRNGLKSGYTLVSIRSALDIDDSTAATQMSRVHSHMMQDEYNKCVYTSKYFDDAPTRKKTRLSQLMRRIQEFYPEITGIDVDAAPYESLKHNKNLGIVYTFELQSNVPQLNGILVDVAFTKADPTNDEIFRMFRREFNDYRKSMKI